MKKMTILIIIALLLLISINPSKINILKNLNVSAENVKEVNSIDTVDKVRGIIYKDKLCVLDGNKLIILNENGEEEYTQDINIENSSINIDNYIDIINKDNNRCYSIDESGKVKFSMNVSQETFLYKSINEYVFVSVSESDTNEILKIFNNDGELNNKIEIDGNVTNINRLDQYILVSYVSITDKIENKIVIYDENGNLKDETTFNDIVLDLLIIDNDVYVVLENSVEILDQNLKSIKTINLGNISSFEKGSEDTIFITDSTGKLGYIKDKKYKEIKTNGEKFDVEGINDTFILYSDNVIYSDKLNKIEEFDSKISDIKSLGKTHIAVFLDNSIKLFKLE